MSDPFKDLPPATPKALTGALWGGVALAAILIGLGTAQRLAHASSLHQSTQEASIPSVSVFQPSASEEAKMVFPGRVQAWQEAPVYARTSGYIKQRLVDIGAQVRSGQVLAEIDAPDLDQQLAAAKANLATTEANLSLAKTTSDRWDRLLSQQAVSVQDAEQKRSELQARRALKEAAQAELARLQSLIAFKRIVAPFDGVVTTRQTDVGQLISAGGGSPTAPLFTVADIKKLRILVSVSQSLLPQLQDGLKASFTMPDQPNQVFEAQLDRTSNAIDPANGAMLIQFVVDNAKGALKPGGYADVSLSLSKKATGASIRIPASALIFRGDGTSVAVLGSDDKVQIKPVKILRDDGKTLEISTGLTPTDWVIDNPSDAIASGAKVKPVKKPSGGAHAHS